MNQRDAAAKRTKVAACIGCGLPFFGFTTKLHRDEYGDVYHSLDCKERWEQELATLDA